jgi:uncharacterized protein involved in type VI secretion and phage assembly
MKEFIGVFAATVTDNMDPESLGRVRVRVAEASGFEEGSDVWARVATLMAGAKRGTWFIPDVGDEVLVAFGRGDPREPYVLGALWSDANPPAEKMAASNDRKVLRSRGGVTIVLDDQAGQESVTLETPGGQRLVLRDGPGAVEITDTVGNSISLGAGGVTVSAAAKVTLRASMIEVHAGMLTVDAGMARFSGVVQCDTLIANSVVGASYTPGAGNIW